jgi:S-methylmethionine-dependent homocysteine/selenocysteine methylase
MAITVLDGGMGGEIQARVEGAGHGLWSAKALVEVPEVVLDIHKEYIDAGARIITTNTYSTIPSYLGKEGMQDQYLEYAQLAGEIARRAVDESGIPGVRVAASVPPLSESYRPDLVPAASEAMPIYQNLVRTLCPFVDLYICETMSSAEEAFNAASAAVTHGENKPVFVSWTLNETPGSGLRSGESITSAYERLQSLDIAGYMFNCTCPEAIVVGLEELRGLTDKPVGCYANRMNKVPEGWTLDNDIQTGRRTDITTDYFIDMCAKCADAGATIIGGCCGIGPKDIRALAGKVAAA